MNRNGWAVGNNLVSLPLFILLVLTLLGGIVGARYFFTGGAYDANELESEALHYRMRDCLARSPELLSSNVFNETVAPTCRLVEKNLNAHLILVRNTRDGTTVFFGIPDYAKRCGFPTEEKPACVTSFIEHEGVVYELVTGADQHSRKVRV